METLLTFDDVLIKPQFSYIKSRAEVNTDNLIISANMASITGIDMCREMAKFNQIGCLHRFMPVEENASMFSTLLNEGIEPWVSVGFEADRLEALAKVKDDAIVVIDVAHGYSRKMSDFIELAQAKFPNLRIVAGNFIEWPMRLLFHKYRPLYGIKIGIGPGSVCTTRLVTGHGYPQLQAILDTVKDKVFWADHSETKIIADGGMESSGDIAKALAAGADMVMTGKLLAYTDKCVTPMSYAGSASQESYSSNGKESSHRAPEGISKTIRYNHPVKRTSQTLEVLLAGLKSAFSYSGAYTAEQFKKSAKLVRISSSTIKENGTR